MKITIDIPDEFVAVMGETHRTLQDDPDATPKDIVVKVFEDYALNHYFHTVQHREGVDAANAVYDGPGKKIRDKRVRAAAKAEKRRLEEQAGSMDVPSDIGVAGVIGVTPI